MNRKTTALLAALTFTALTMAATLISACGGGAVSCTEIGCGDQLTINFVDSDGDLIETFDGAFTFDDETVDFECTGGDDAYGSEYHCRQGALILSASPDELEIDVSSGDLSRSTTLTPDYDEVQPNGPDCPPTCQQGEETVELE